MYYSCNILHSEVPKLLNIAVFYIVRVLNGEREREREREQNFYRNRVLYILKPKYAIEVFIDCLLQMAIQLCFRRLLDDG